MPPWNEKEYWIFCNESIREGPAMAFRLNDMHKIKPECSRIRGKRTLAKDRLYRHIPGEIRTLKPALDPKISTAADLWPEGK